MNITQNINHKPFVFLDIETTGGSAFIHKITEIGAIRVEKNSIVRTFQTFINPGVRIPAFITELTGIRDQDVKNAPKFKEVTNELKALLQGATFIAHNVNFDYSFIVQEFARLSESFRHDRMCTVRLSRRLYPQEKRHNLDSVIARHGFEVINRHRALDDATVLYEFYKASLDKFGLQVYAHMDKLTTLARPTKSTPA